MMAVLSECRQENSSRVIDAIYDAALDAGLWPRALEVLRRYVWADSAAVRVCREAWADVIQATTVGFDFNFFLSYRDECFREDWVLSILGALPSGRMLLLEDAPTSDSALNPRGLCLRPERPHLIAGTLHRKIGLDVVIVLHRGRDAPPFGARELTRLKRVVPHLARAWSLADRLDHLLLGAVSADTMLGTTAAGVIFFDASGGVTHMSHGAQVLLDGQRALKLHNQRLRTPYPRLQQWLDQVTVSVRREADEYHHEGSSARFTSYDGQGDLALTILPWKHSKVMPALAVSEVATIGLLASLDCRGIFPIGRIEALFGLTKGEAALAAALVTTGSLAAAAQCLDIRLSTARDRLKSVFRKTGFTSQMALACALVRSAMGQVPPASAATLTRTDWN